MFQIHHVGLPAAGINEVQLPRKAVVLGIVISINRDFPCLVVQSDTEEPNETRLFYATTCGRIPFEANNIEQRAYVGCAQVFPEITHPVHVLEVALAKGAK